MAVIITSPELLEGLSDRLSRQPAKRVISLKGINTVQLVRTKKTKTVACRLISDQNGIGENFDNEEFEFVGSVVIYDLQQTQALLGLKVSDDDTIAITDGVPSVVAGVVKDTPTKPKKPVVK